jgi:hypothetical protein
MARTRKKSSFNLWSGNLEAYEVMYDFVCQIFPKYADAPWASRPKLPGFRGKDWDAKMLELAAAMNHHFADRRGSKSYSKGGVEIQLMYTLQQCINSKGYPFGDDQEWRKSFAISNLTNAIARGFIRPEHVHSFGLEWLGRFAEEPFLNVYFPKHTRQDLIDAGMAASVPKTKRRSTMAEKKSKEKTYDFDIEDYYKRINNLDRDEQISIAIESAQEALQGDTGLTVRQLECVKEVLKFLQKVKSSKYKVTWVLADKLRIEEYSQHRKENHKPGEKKVNKDTIADRGVDRPILGFLKNASTGEVVVINGCHRTEIVQELIQEGKLPKDFKMPVYLVPNQQDFLENWFPVLEEVQSYLNVTRGVQATTGPAEVRKYTIRQIAKIGIDLSSLPKDSLKLVKTAEYKRVCSLALSTYKDSTMPRKEIKKNVTRAFTEHLKGSNDNIKNFSDEDPNGELRKILKNSAGLLPIKNSSNYSMTDTFCNVTNISKTDNISVFYLKNQRGSSEMQTYLEKIPDARYKKSKSVLVYMDHKHRGDEKSLFVELEHKFNVAKKWYHFAITHFGKENGKAVPDLILIPNKIGKDCTVSLKGAEHKILGRKNAPLIMVTRRQLEAWFESGEDSVPLEFMVKK